MKHVISTAALLTTAFFAISCSMPAPDDDEETRAIMGDLRLPNGTHLPAGSDLVVSFRGMGGQIFAEERMPLDDREPPYPFQLIVPVDRIGTLAGRVEEGDHTTWRTVSVLLDQATHSVDLGMLDLEPAPEGFMPAARMDGADTRRDRQVRKLARPGDAEPLIDDVSETRAATAAELEASIAPRESERSRLQCGDSDITVLEESGTAQVKVGEIVVEMEATDAADGSGGRRYAVPNDPATYLSLDGSAVEVSFAGVVLADCARAGPTE